MANVRIGLASGCLAVFLSAACGTVAVKVPVMKPAEINMAPYQSVAIGGLTERSDRSGIGTGTTGASLHPLTGMLEEALVSANRFQVLDRQHLDSLLSEQKLSSSDLADQNSVSKLGKVVTAGAFIFGDVSDGYRENRKAEKCSTLFDKKQHTCRSVTGAFSVHATFKIVDVTTGQLKFAKRIEETKEQTNEGMDEQPEPVDRETLARETRALVIERFMKAIVPHQEYANAMFRKDGDIPQFETGIGWAQHGDWKKAQDTFNTVAQNAEKNVNLKAPQIAKCYWNLGLSYEYAGDYDKATEVLNKAFTLSNDQDMLSELDNVKRMQAAAKKVAEQTTAEAADPK
jgi:curli biogenesis system outer membrane secretion channel CsgG